MLTLHLLIKLMLIIAPEGWVKHELHFNGAVCRSTEIAFASVEYAPKSAINVFNCLTLYQMKWI